jgi:putative transposase
MLSHDTMARLARVIVPGLPHHVTQRGNRREPIFFEDGDQEVYRDLLAEQGVGAGSRSGPIA